MQQGGAVPYPTGSGPPNYGAQQPPPGMGFAPGPPGPPGPGVPTGGYPPGPPGPPGPPQAGGPDVMDNPAAAEAVPSAPPMDKMDTIAGYGNTTFDGALAPPPGYDEAMQGPPPTRSSVRDVPVINEDEARDALLQFVSGHCCYGKGAARQMQLRDLKSSSAFHYTLETFGESRTTTWAYEPFIGQPVDGPHNGPAPGPWDIQAQPQTKFKDAVTQLEVPHTASVKPCHACIGNCRVRCNHCHGNGRTICSTCSGSGREQYFEDGRHRHRHCTWCSGDGRRRCTWCHGHGQVPCKTCNAKGQLKCFIKLTIKWTNHMDDHIVERTALPDELIRQVSGQTAFEEELPMVWPVNHFPDQTINQASRQLVDRHKLAFPNERILLQRHRVRIVPVTEVISNFKDKDFSYFVFGFEHVVHAPNYPQKCCCGCTIL